MSEQQQPEQVEINLWSCMTTLAGRDLPQSDKAEALTTLADKTHGFTSEISLTVDQYGNWVVRLHCHEGSSNEVELRVTRHGGISVKRILDGNVRDERRVSF